MPGDSPLYLDKAWAAAIQFSKSELKTIGHGLMAIRSTSVNSFFLKRAEADLSRRTYFDLRDIKKR